MSSQTDALYSALKADLQAHVSPFQVSFLESGGAIWPDATLKQVASAQLMSKIFSKFTVRDEVSPVASQAALEKFLLVNNRGRDFEPHLNDEIDAQLLNEVKQTLWWFFNPDGYPLIDSYEEIIAKGGVGPGASLNAHGTDLYTKIFSSPLSFTKESLLISWEQTVSQDDRWFEALVSLYQGGRIPAAVDGNSLSFVSKNQQVARCICTEPTINMWYQLGIGAIITERLKSYFGIELSTQQDINRSMARSASNGADFCTIDLESASDCVTVGLLQAILPASALEWLMKVRSPVTRLPDGEVVTLNMVSTMGNGFTFPLQTAIFAAIVAAVYRNLDLPLVKRGSADKRTFAVFGDDIICSKQAYRTVVRLLAVCGFKVNEAKSFSQGLFYESCGGDYFDGHYVRAFYIKKLDCPQDTYKAINGLNRWSAIQGIPLVRTVSMLLSTLKSPQWVPSYESDDAGIQVPLDLAPTSARKYIMPGLYSYKYSTPRKGFLDIKFIDIEFDESTHVYAIDNKACGKSRRRLVNPSGLWLSFLIGCVRGYRITLRQRRVRYTTRRRVTPSWDARSPLHSRLEIGWRSWSDYVSYNLFGF